MGRRGKINVGITRNTRWKRFWLLQGADAAHLAPIPNHPAAKDHEKHQKTSSPKSWADPSLCCWSCFYGRLPGMALPRRVSHWEHEEPNLPTSQSLIYHIPPLLPVCTGVIAPAAAAEPAPPRADRNGETSNIFIRVALYLHLIWCLTPGQTNPTGSETFSFQGMHHRESIHPSRPG